VLKRYVLLPAIAVMAVGVTATAYVQISRAGLSASPAAPQTLVPAATELYVGINRGGDQGAALSSLWQAYQAHPGTAAALRHLQRTLATSGLDLSRVASVADALGDRAAVAVWPAPQGGTTPSAVVVAQVKAAAVLTGKNPFAGYATITTSGSYHGTTLYRIAFKGATQPAYGCLLAGDGVIGANVASLKQVIDLAAHPSGKTLATDPTFVTTMQALPASRILTFYDTPAFIKDVTHASQAIAARHAALSGGVGSTSATAALSRLAQRQPVGLAVSATAGGLAVQTTGASASLPVGTTPNEGAGIVGHNALLYASMDNPGHLIKSAFSTYGPLLSPSFSLPQIETQVRTLVGIDLEQDVFPLLSGELVLDLNDGTPPLLAAYAGQMAGQNSSPAATIPGGSALLALHVPDAQTAQASIARLIAALNRQTASSTVRFVRTTLADGSTAYTPLGLESIGYRFKGNWLIISPNLSGDVAASAQPLAMDPAYQAALARVTAPGALTGVTYVDLGRTLGLADRWIAYAQQVSPQTVSALNGKDGWTWREVKALIAPVHSITSASHRGAAGQSGQVFIAIGS
jgi:hypothetical protein